MEKRNVETWNCKGCGPVTRVSSCHPGLRRGTSRRPWWRSDGRRRVRRCSSKHRLVRTERGRCCPLRPALGVLRPGVRKVYGRRWAVASLRIKPKRSGSSRSFLCSTLSMLDSRPEESRTPSFRLFFWSPRLAGFERAGMNRSPLYTSGCGGEVTIGSDSVCFIGVDRK